jgi:hypothetical protein
MTKNGYCDTFIWTLVRVGMGRSLIIVTKKSRRADGEFYYMGYVVDVHDFDYDCVHGG